MSPAANAANDTSHSHAGPLNAAANASDKPPTTISALCQCDQCTTPSLVLGGINRQTDALPVPSLPARSLKVLEDLVRARPLTRLHNEVDVAALVAVQRMIGDARGIDAECSQLVAPRHRCVLILERADGLPSLKPRIADGNRRVLRGTAQRVETSHRVRSVRPTPTRAPRVPWRSSPSQHR